MLFWARLQATRILAKLPAKRIFTKKLSDSVFPKQNKKTLVTTGYDFRPFTPTKHNVILRQSDGKRLKSSRGQHGHARLACTTKKQKCTVFTVRCKKSCTISSVVQRMNFCFLCIGRCRLLHAFFRNFVLFPCEIGAGNLPLRLVLVGCQNFLKKIRLAVLYLFCDNVF